MKRDNRFTISLSDKELKMLERHRLIIETELGLTLSRSNVIRKMIMDAIQAYG